MLNLNILGDQAYEISLAHGFREAEINYSTIMLLFQSEVSEALEDYRKNHGIREYWYERKVLDCYIETIAKLPHNSSDIVSTDKLCGIPSELADIVIRICEQCSYWRKVDGYQEADLDGIIENIIFCLKPNTDNFEECLAKISWAISKSYESKNHFEICNFLAIAIYYVFHIAVVNEIDLQYIIKQKMEYNKTREFKHGNKRF
jgi:hypothetical protein